MKIEDLEEILAEPREETIIVFPISLFEKAEIKRFLIEKNLEFEFKEGIGDYYLVFINFNFTQKQILKAAGL